MCTKSDNQYNYDGKSLSLLRINRMKKSALLTLVAATMMISIVPTYAANSNAPASGGGNKVTNGFKAVGRGIMWGPKKVGNGFKKMFHKKGS